MNRKKFAAHTLLWLTFLSAAHAGAQKVETGFLNRTVMIDGDYYRYQVYVPREFQRSSRWPVILALHGGGGYGNDGLRQTIGSLADAIRRHPERFPAVVLFPQAHADGTPGWQGAGGRAALAAVDSCDNYGRRHPAVPDVCV